MRSRKAAGASNSALPQPTKHAIFTDIAQDVRTDGRAIVKLLFTIEDEKYA